LLIPVILELRRLKQEDCCKFGFVFINYKKNIFLYIHTHIYTHTYTYTHTYIYTYTHIYLFIYICICICNCICIYIQQVDFGVLEIWTQGLTNARQVLCHWSRGPAPQTLFFLTSTICKVLFMELRTQMWTKQDKQTNNKKQCYGTWLACMFNSQYYHHKTFIYPESWCVI